MIIIPQFGCKSIYVKGVPDGISFIEWRKTRYCLVRELGRRNWICDPVADDYCEHVFTLKIEEIDHA